MMELSHTTNFAADSICLFIIKYTVMCWLAQETNPVKYIKIHDSVLCHPGTCTHNPSILTKYGFTAIRSSVIFCPNKTQFAVQVLAYQGRLPTRFQVNHTSDSWDMSLQKVAHFLNFFSSILFSHTCKNCHKMQTRNWIAWHALKGI